MEGRTAAGQNPARLVLAHSLQQLHDSMPGYFDTGEMTRGQVDAARQRCRAIMLALTAEPAGKEPREAGKLDWEAWERSVSRPTAPHCLRTCRAPPALKRARGSANCSSTCPACCPAQSSARPRSSAARLSRR